LFGVYCGTSIQHLAIKKGHCRDRKELERAAPRAGSPLRLSGRRSNVPVGSRGGIVILSGRVLKVPCHFGVGPLVSLLAAAGFIEVAAAQLAKFKLPTGSTCSRRGWRRRTGTFPYTNQQHGEPTTEAPGVAGATCTGSLRWLYKMRGSLPVSMRAPVPVRSGCLAVLREPAAPRA
jgi:hypothetical protein